MKKDSQMKEKSETQKIKKVLLTQPNYAMFGKRIWKLFPYSLAILNACINKDYNTELFDPNFNNLNEEEIIKFLKESNPDVIGLGTVSTEYSKDVFNMTSIIKKTLPNVILVEGGTFPTVFLEEAMKDKNVDYWITGEAEISFLSLLNELNKEKPDLSIGGLSYYENGNIKINPKGEFIQDLDNFPFADYGNLDFMGYANQNLKFAQGLRARRPPYAITITSRGCPYRCVFCSGPRVSGKKVRMRSANNVLKEIDELYAKGIREIIFLDDHFLFDRKRAIDIMKGLIERKYDLLWKCCNLTVFLLDEEFLEFMKQSGCYQITVSIESGDQYVLNNIIKKPVNLEKIPAILELIRKNGIEIIANFVIGFPKETWEQIRTTFAYAEKIPADIINFHIATPLPKTELMEECIEKGFIKKENISRTGYTQGIISTEEFTPKELQILRAFEWDRINFATKEKREKIAEIEGISLEELDRWRKETRAKVGVDVKIIT